MRAKTVTATRFKARCLDLIDQVARDGQPLTVTKYGRAIVRVIPSQAKSRSLFGYMAGTIRIAGDIISPIGGVWDAER